MRMDLDDEEEFTHFDDLCFNNPIVDVLYLYDEFIS
jgi:hypothetical protein